MSNRRDLFAAAALQGLLAGRNPAATAWSTLEVARVAVECADYVISVMDSGAAAVEPAPIAEPTTPVVPDDVDGSYLSLIK